MENRKADAAPGIYKKEKKKKRGGGGCTFTAPPYFNFNFCKIDEILFLSGGGGGGGGGGHSPSPPPPKEFVFGKRSIEWDKVREVQTFIEKHGISADLLLSNRHSKNYVVIS